MNGGDFGFLEGIPEKSTGCRQDTHAPDTLVQYSLFTARIAQLMRMTQELHRHLCV